MSIVVVGAGLSGAVIARDLADAGFEVVVFEQRHHVAGNCHTLRDTNTGVMVHEYGPHIFHTDDSEVWAYISRFGKMAPYNHRVKSTVGGQVFSLPVNLHTINQFFGKTMRPEEAKTFIREIAEQIDAPVTFEEQALAFVGRDLYEAFFKGYTEKQWGCAPDELPASILKRLPLRFDYNDSYFHHRFQGIPVDGYTSIVTGILDHPKIDLRLDRAFDPAQVASAEHVFWSGPLDAFFEHRLGRLAYRTLDFERFEADGDYQGCAVMNYGDAGIPYTRVTEHKHFAPWETHEKSVLFRESPRDCEAGDIPYYPVRLVKDKELLGRYVEMARQVDGVTFVGRLGTYRYLDMDVTIREALDIAEVYKTCVQSGTPVPHFSVSPV